MGLVAIRFREKGGVNLYDYVGNNPTSGRDPSGLFDPGTDTGIGIGTGIGTGIGIAGGGVTIVVGGLVIIAGAVIAGELSPHSAPLEWQIHT